MTNEEALKRLSMAQRIRAWIGEVKNGDIVPQLFKDGMWKGLELCGEDGWEHVSIGAARQVIFTSGFGGVKACSACVWSQGKDERCERFSESVAGVCILWDPFGDDDND